MNKQIIFVFSSLIMLLLFTSCSTSRLTSENKAFIEEYLEALSGKEKPAEVVDRYISESDQILKDHIFEGEAAFPLYELIIDDIIGENEMVVVRATFRGTPKSAANSTTNSNKEIVSPMAIIYKVENKKIVKHWIFSQN